MEEKPDKLHGKLCLVTGATAGLGQAAALAFARRGAHVVIVGRSTERIAHTTQMLRAAAAPGSIIESIQADLSSMAEVRRAANEFLAKYASLDILVNNVGATLLSYQVTVDGYERSWALNYLSHFLLSYLLQGALKSAAVDHGEARIVELSSSVYRLSDSHFLTFQQARGYDGVMAYAQTKRAIIVYTAELARRLAGSGVSINAVTPGLVKTQIAQENGWVARGLMTGINLFAKSAEKGVQPVIWLAADPAIKTVSGKYFGGFQEMRDDPTCHQPEDVRRLWEISEQMTGLKR